MKRRRRMTISPTTSVPPTGTTIWTGNFEANLSDIYYPETSATGNFGGGEYDSNGAVASWSGTNQRSGSGCAKFRLPAGGVGAVRMFRWREPHATRTLLMEAWFKIPEVTLNGTDRYWILDEIKSRRQSTGEVEPFLFVIVGNSPATGTARRLRLDWSAYSGLEGPHSGENGYRQYTSTVDVPVNEYWGIRWLLTQSHNFDGQSKFWYLHGTDTPQLLWDLQNIRTGHQYTGINAWEVDQHWAATSYCDGIAGGAVTDIYVDDMSISAP